LQVKGDAGKGDDQPDIEKKDDEQEQGDGDDIEKRKH
jgi:hypothetical protein